jgi:hypothetical protein
VGKIFSERINPIDRKEGKTQEKLCSMKQARKNENFARNLIWDWAWKNPSGLSMII